MADLKTQYQSIEREIRSALGEVFDRCQFILGENVKELEKEIADRCDAKFGVGVASGTDSLLMALVALGVAPGDEVITTSFTFVATTEVIALLGATPVYVDIDPETYCLDPMLVEDRITPRTRAILPVHLYGQCAEARTICEIARAYKLRVVFDGAQAIGAKHFGRGIGAFGDATALSFFPTKNLGAYGDGGMVLTNDPEIAERIRLLRFHGSGGSYTYGRVGYCSRLDELQAAVLRVKLRHLDEWEDARRAHAARYNARFGQVGLSIPAEREHNRHVYHQYTLRHPRRDEMVACMKEAGVFPGIYYSEPLHRQPAYRHLGYGPGDLPETDAAAEEVFSIPVYPELSRDQMDFVIETVSAAALREAQVAPDTTSVPADAGESRSVGTADLR